MIKHKFLFWASVIAICLGAIVGFQNQIPVKTDSTQSKKNTLSYSVPDIKSNTTQNQSKNSILDYFVPAIQNNPIVKSIESFDFGFNSSSPVIPKTPTTTPPRTTISALAYGTYFIGSDGSSKNLLGQNLNTPLRIASITKLMTALVAVSSIDKNEVIEISQADLVDLILNRYKVGDKLTFDQLLYSLLIESDNNAAQAIADHFGSAKFIEAMNSEALKLGMINTKYFNPSGLDSTDSSQDNISTVSDLTKLTQYMELKYPNIFAITALSSYKIIDSTGKLHHEAFSTDKLIDEFAVNYMVGGKTGYTGRAKQNLLILRAKNGDDGYYIDTVLSSDDRFGDMKLLISKNAN
ncbi:MAG: serine hydrolase [bacterium]